MSVAIGWLAVLVTLLAFVWTVQRRLIYFPSDRVPSPSALGLMDIESVGIDTRDGLRLGGWFFPAVGRPRATVIVFNGNAGHRAHRVPLAQALRQQGVQTLLFDYRGYGGNAGSPSESGLAEDARAVRAYLAARPEVEAARLVYFGESLGTGVAVGLAMEQPPAALILRSPFTSMADVGQHHYPWLPVRLLLRDRFPVETRLRQLRVPLLVIAGDRDRVVPIEQSRQVFENAAAPKTLLVLPGIDHNDGELLAGTRMVRAIVEFLGSV
jgi:fermentation-respiration switch protein FrsA (DUF1100 family)